MVTGVNFCSRLFAAYFFLFLCFVIFRLDSLQQTKARLEVSHQTLKHQHAKELEGREEDLEQVKITLNKKLKALTEQLEEEHEEKAMAVKVRRDKCRFVQHTVTSWMSIFS